MADSEQDQVMDAKLIADRQVIERYLAGQLSDAEADAFERDLEANPELAREILVVAEQYDGDIGRKNAFANGVLYIIGLEYNTKEAAYLQQLLSISKEAIPSDGVDGEGQPLSA